MSSFKVRRDSREGHALQVGKEHELLGGFVRSEGGSWLPGVSAEQVGVPKHEAL